jgi:hypothetical protein
LTLTFIRDAEPVFPNIVPTNTGRDGIPDVLLPVSGLDFIIQHFATGTWHPALPKADTRHPRPMFIERLVAAEIRLETLNKFFRHGDRGMLPFRKSFELRAIHGRSDIAPLLQQLLIGHRSHFVQPQSPVCLQLLVETRVSAASSSTSRFIA